MSSVSHWGRSGYLAASDWTQWKFYDGGSINTACPEDWYDRETEENINLWVVLVKCSMQCARI